MKDFRDISLLKKILVIFATILTLAGVVIILANIVDMVEGDQIPWFNETNVVFITFATPLLLSFIFLRFNKKSLLVTFSLVALVLGYAFYYYIPIRETLIATVTLYCLCAFQVFILIYCVWLTKGVGFKILDLAIRVGLSLLAFFLLPEYLPDYFSSVENVIFTIYLINSLISLIVLLIHFRENYILWCGLLLIFAGTIFYMFMFGGLELFNINTSGFANFINSFDIAFLCTSIGIYLLSLSATFSSNVMSKPGQNF